MMKPFLLNSAILSMLLLCSPTAGLAAVGDEFTAGDFTYTVTSEGESNTVSATKFSSEGTDATIPATVANEGNTYTVTQLGDGLFGDCYGLKSVTIPETVTSLGNSCFSWCISLTDVTIPNGVTSIGGYCFGTCI